MNAAWPPFWHNIIFRSNLEVIKGVYHRSSVIGLLHHSLLVPQFNATGRIHQIALLFAE